ncbi:EXLDI family protein [Nocardia tenerifensis]|uniref:EXLDI family protein n=1 Tax=Nocardia tenerifensis TaxID=228006 RepID=A0A318K843_9NOCA|nr:EXLDI protein [Nocardia tenerifensis]PXX66658.1 EXLDI family protein [Nocardia tenerifensis]
MDTRHAGTGDEVVGLDKGEEFREVVVKVGPGGGRAQRFVGRLLGESTHFTSAGIELIRVYLGRKGKYAVHRQATDWTDFAVMSDWVKDFRKDWRQSLELDDRRWSDSTLDVANSFEELRDRLPARVFRTLTDPTEHPSVETLDI